MKLFMCWTSHHRICTTFYAPPGQSAKSKKCPPSADGASIIQDNQQQSEATTVPFRVCRRRLQQEVVKRSSFWPR